MKSIVCAIAKLENDYLYEWAKYHLDLGFSAIHIYDNNDEDGEKVSDVFKGTDCESQICIHDVRGKHYMQKQVYQEFYDNEEFDWCAFIDIDEFITFTEASGIKSIEDFLKDKADWEAVHLNWMCYGDNGMTRKKDEPVTKRFKHPKKPFDFHYTYLNHSENEHIKSIIRKGLKINWPDSNPHTPIGLEKICNALGKPVENTPFSDIVHETAYIRHYMTKTIEEYAAKVSRQCADCDAVFYSFPKFFRANRPSFSKLIWLKKHYPQMKKWNCVKEYWKFVIVNHHIPLRFLFRSLSKNR